MTEVIQERLINAELYVALKLKQMRQSRIYKALLDDRGDVPGWLSEYQQSTLQSWCEVRAALQGL